MEWGCVGLTGHTAGGWPFARQAQTVLLRRVPPSRSPDLRPSPWGWGAGLPGTRAHALLPRGRGLGLSCVDCLLGAGSWSAL